MAAKFMTTAEIADAAGCSRATVARAIISGELKGTLSTKPGRGRKPYLIPAGEAQKFIRKQK